MSGSPGPRSRRPATVRFYCDADVIGLAKVLQRVRSDVTYPGDPGGMSRGRTRPPCPITDPATPDDVWIPEVARRGWVTITRDKRIATRPAELKAVIDNQAKLVAIASTETLDTFGMLEVVMTQWRFIERLAGAAGPSMWAISRSSVRSLISPDSP